MLKSFVCYLALLSLLVSSAQAGGFVDQEARQHLFMSYASYCNPSTLFAWDCTWCNYVDGNNFIVTAIVQNSTYDNFGFVGYNHSSNSIYVVFRGTVESDIKNWIEDLSDSKAVPAFVPGVEVHSGFLEGYESLQNQVYSAVRSLLAQYPSATLVVTGHSLGGALATLFAADYSRQYNNIVLYTYGSPRVGNRAFSDFVSSQSGIQNRWRVVNSADLVPHLPTESMGFYHIANEAWYPVVGGSSYKVCYSGEDNSCSDSLSFPISISDHLHYYGYTEGCEH